MSHLTNVELDSLRHLIGCHELGAKKLGAYAQTAQDSQLKTWCQRQAEECNRAKQELMSFLNEGATMQ